MRSPFRLSPGEHKPMIVFEALQPARRDVVLDRRRGGVRFSGEAFLHLRKSF